MTGDNKRGEGGLTPVSDAPVIQEARRTRRQARILDARGRILEGRAKEVTFQHTVFCQTGLPYDDPGTSVRAWEKEQGFASLRINAGEARDPETKQWVELGLPFGEKARLVLMDLNQTALRTQSPQIEVHDSMSAYLVERLRLARTGRNIAMLKDQLARLSAATIRLAVTDDSRGFQFNTNIVSAFDLWFPKDDRQRILWPSLVRLSDDYFNSLMAHAVPLKEDAIGALAHSALCLDLYCWLAQRLHRVPKHRPQFITWAALKAQFGAGYSRMDNFKRFFRRQIRQVLMVYPEAKVKGDNKGVTLYNSQPPVRKRQIGAGGKR